MVDVGLVLVGPGAADVDVGDAEVPVVSCCVDPVRPVPAELAAVAAEQARLHFGGVDAERWSGLSGRELAAESSILWATAQVSGENLAAQTAGWRRALVVAWAGEPALVPALRALSPQLLVTVLLGGAGGAQEAEARRNATVAADLVRRGRVLAVLHAPRPSLVLDVALEAARVGEAQAGGTGAVVDIGALLEVGPVPVRPEPAVSQHTIAHRALGRAHRLGDLLASIAAHDALHALLHGPPVDVEGLPVVDIDALRETLPGGDVFGAVQQRVLHALSGLELDGDGALVEAIAAALRPVQHELLEVDGTCRAIEHHRTLRMRAFGAAGIHFTAQRLRTQLDELYDATPTPPEQDLRALLGGELGARDEEVHPLAWRRLFAGVSRRVVRRGQPGWRVAREMVAEQLARFRAAFAVAVASSCERRIRRARDPRSPLPADALIELHDRAAAVRDALDAVVAALDAELLVASETALRDDALLRLVAPDAGALRDLLRRWLERSALGAELERAATVALCRRPLGMVEPEAFGAYLDEVVQAASSLVAQATLVPGYDEVMIELLASHDPATLREQLVHPADAQPTLYVPAGSSGKLLAWLERARLPLRAADLASPCVIAWRPVGDVLGAQAEAARRTTREHRLDDLLLPPPEGDTPASLARLARAVAAVVLGLFTGELEVDRAGDSQLLWVAGDALPQTLWLPYAAYHALAADPATLDALERRARAAAAAVASRPEAERAVVALVEWVALGPAPRMREQLGLGHARLAALQPAVDGLLRNALRRATVSMVEHRRVDGVRALVQAPARRRYDDLLTLATGGTP